MIVMELDKGQNPQFRIIPRYNLMRVLVHVLTNIEGRVGVVVTVVTSIPRIEKDKGLH